MENIFGDLVNDAQFAKILPANAHRCSVSSDQTHQNIPHHLLRQQQFAKILLLQYFSAWKQTVISIFPVEFCTHWVNQKTLSAQIMYGALTRHAHIMPE